VTTPRGVRPESRRDQAIRDNVSETNSGSRKRYTRVLLTDTLRMRFRRRMLWSSDRDPLLISSNSLVLIFYWSLLPGNAKFFRIGRRLQDKCISTCRVHFFIRKHAKTIADSSAVFIFYTQLYVCMGARVCAYVCACVHVCTYQFA